MPLDLDLSHANWTGKRIFSDNFKVGMKLEVKVRIPYQDPNDKSDYSFIDDYFAEGGFYFEAGTIVQIKRFSGINRFDYKFENKLIEVKADGKSYIVSAPRLGDCSIPYQETPLEQARRECTFLVKRLEVKNAAAQEEVAALKKQVQELTEKVNKQTQRLRDLGDIPAETDPKFDLLEVN